MQKKIILSVVALLALGAAILVAHPGESKVKSYYSGDAVNYNDQVLVGTTNTGKFELFALQGSKLVRETVISSNDRESQEFYDSFFDKVGGKLYVYLVNGRYLYRYDLSNPEIPVQDLKIKDNSWDWFTRVDKVNGYIVTVGSKGTKIWNQNFQVIDSYAMINNSTLGSAKMDGKLAFAMKDKLSIYNTASRQKVAEYSIAVNDKQASRGLSVDDDRNLVYLVDDQSFKAVNFSGQVVNKFDHISNAGYDVADSIVNPDQIYFSDGVGVVKMDKETFKPMNWTYTVGNNLPGGSWAMGLKTVSDGSGEKLVVFNGSNILVLNQKMQTVADYQSVEQDYRPVEALFLSVDKTFATGGSRVALNGGGFGLGEDLKIEFGNNISQVKADENGRFQTIVTVPTLTIHPAPADIKVTGLNSKKTYSISFKVE